MSSEENLMEGIEISQESQEQGQNNHDKELKKRNGFTRETDVRSYLQRVVGSSSKKQDKKKEPIWFNKATLFNLDKIELLRPDNEHPY